MATLCHQQLPYKDSAGLADSFRGDVPKPFYVFPLMFVSRLVLEICVNRAWLKCPEPSYVSRKETLMVEFGKQSSCDITGTSTLPGMWGVVDVDTQHQHGTKSLAVKEKNPRANKTSFKLCSICVLRAPWPSINNKIYKLRNKKIREAEGHK